MNEKLIKKENNSIISKNSFELEEYNLKKLLYRQDICVSDVLYTDGISKDNKAIILASLNEVKLKFIDLDADVNSWNTLKDILVKTIWESGFKMEHDDQKLFITLAIEDIKNEFEMLTISDVRIALKNGVRKKHGEFYGMNITTINVWLNTYSEMTKKEALKQLYLVKPPEVEKVYTEEEIKQNHDIWINSVYNEFYSYRDTNTYSFIDFKGAFYDYAKRIGLLNLSDEEKDRIHAEALLQYKKSKHLKNAVSVGERAEFKHILDNLNKGNQDNYKEAIMNICKKIAVKELLTTFVKKDKDLKVMIEKLLNNSNYAT